MNNKRLAYLDNAATTLKPVIVIEAMNDYLLRHTSNVHRGIYQLSEQNTLKIEESRMKVQKFLHAARPEEIIFTSGTTESINLLASSLSMNLSSEDEIILTEIEHHANIVPWQMQAKKFGFKIKILRLNDQGLLDPNDLFTLISEKTKIFSFTLTSNTLGMITPFKEMIKIAKASGLTVIADAAQAVAHFDINVADLDLDFLAFSGHKLFGPTGVGVLYGKYALLENLAPYKGGGNMIETVTFEETTFNKVPEKFEAGTPPIAEIIGLGAAIDFVNHLGFSFIHQKEEELLNKMQSEFNQRSDLFVYGNLKNKVPIFAFNLKNVHPHDLGQILDKEGVAIRTGHHCTQPIMKLFKTSAMARASLSFYNSMEDIEQFFQAIDKAKKLLL
jgi:cysteine desulfurase/selenocysteine lyase